MTFDALPALTVSFGYLLWFAILILRPSRCRPAFAMLAAATAAWAGLDAWEQLDRLPANVPVIADVVRLWTWAWLLHVLAGIWGQDGQSDDAPRRAGSLTRAPIAIATFLAAISIAASVFSGIFGSFYTPLDNCTLGRLGLAIVGLLLVENLVAVAPQQARWAIKHLVIGFGAAFAFGLFAFSEALLLRQISSLTDQVLPFVVGFVLPFVWVAERRLHGFRSDIAVSREVVLRTSALVACGLYLLGVASVGFMVQRFEWNWGPALQMAGFVGALMVLAVMMASTEVRARIRWWFTRNFFRLHYDYRNEWLRFVETMAGEDATTGRLHERAIKATADLLDCSSGVLYLGSRTGGFRLAAETALEGARTVPVLPESLVARLTPDEPTLDLSDSKLEWPSDTSAWRQELATGWVLLGLQHRNRLVGALLLADPRVGRPLSWEDRDLLQIFSAQIGSYVAEEQVTLALAEAQRFERMSKNFSFIAHDIKNLVTQLSLIVSQAKRHGDNPEFQQDVLSTVSDSVEKMRAMLLRLREVRAEDDRPSLESVALAPLLKDLFERKGALIGRLAVTNVEEGLQVMAEPTTLSAVLENLVQNALDAVGEAGHVQVAANRQQNTDNREEAVISIADNGKGMTQAFIDDYLFQPFVSTKDMGFGLGMYQCREWVQRWDGRLEVESAPGEGTCTRVVLPLTQMAESAA